MLPVELGPASAKWKVPVRFHVDVSAEFMTSAMNSRCRSRISDERDTQSKGGGGGGGIEAGGLAQLVAR